MRRASTVPDLPVVPIGRRAIPWRVIFALLAALGVGGGGYGLSELGHECNSMSQAPLAPVYPPMCSPCAPPAAQSLTSPRAQPAELLSADCSTQDDGRVHCLGEDPATW